ncbi:MAG: hypothetical protein ACRDHY_07640, partial [Anaerolineales bacterium]
ALPLWPAAVVLAALGVAVCPGLFHLWIRGQRLLVLLVACTLALVAVTPWPAQFGRYLAPLSPVLAIALANTLVLLQRRARPLAIGLCALVLGIQALTLRQTFSVFSHDAIQYPRPGREPAAGKMFFFGEALNWRPFYAALAWLRENAPADAIVATSCPHLAWLHAGRKAVMPPLVPDDEDAMRLLDAVPVDYAIIDSLRFVDISRRYAAPVMERHPEVWEPVLKDPSGRVKVYRRRR